MAFPRQVILTNQFRLACVSLYTLVLLANQVEVTILETIGIATDFGGIAALAALRLNSDGECSATINVKNNVIRAVLTLVDRQQASILLPQLQFAVSSTEIDGKQSLVMISNQRHISNTILIHVTHHFIVTPSLGHQLFNASSLLFQALSVNTTHRADSHKRNNYLFHCQLYFISANIRQKVYI